jgi:LysR family nitrogen assimilation transcriptional regulator
LPVLSFHLRDAEARRINLKQLIYFRKAIEAGNITQAAKELNVAQTALGIQIRNLEKELGVSLLERHSRGVAATPGGELLNRYAEEILALAEEARQAVRKLADNQTTSLKLGLTPSIVRLVGDDILIDLSRTIPNIALRMVEEFSFVLMRLLEQGELSCALTFAPDQDPRFVRRALLEEDLFYLTAPALTPESATITFREVLNSELALTGRQDVVFRTVEEMAGRLGMDLAVAYEVQSIRAVKNLVAKGIAATIMPYGAAEGELRSGALKARLIVAPSVTRTLMFVYPREMSATVDDPHFRAFIDAIADRLHAAEGPVTRRL